MPIADPLSLAAEQRWRALARPDEEVVLSVASDVTASGAFGERWLLITNQRVLVLPAGGTPPQLGNGADGQTADGRVATGAAPGTNGHAGEDADGYVALSFDELTDAKTEPLVGGGRLEVYTGNIPVSLVEYSSSLGPKFAEVARGLQQVIKGNPFHVSDDIPKLRCEKCGRLLADKHASCSRCVRRSAILLRLMRYMKPVWPLSLALAIATGGRTIMQLAPPYLQKIMIDGVLTPPVAGGPPKPQFGDYSFLVLLVAGTAAAGLGTALLQVAGAWLAAVVGTRVTLDIRGQLYRTLERLSLTFHNKREQGALMSLVTRDTDQLNYFLIEGLPYLVTNALMLIAILAILLSMNWQLALFILIPAPLVVAGGAMLWRRMRAIFNRWSQSWALFSAHLGESLAGIRVSKAFHQENAEIERFDRRNEDLARITIREG
ncbi:MAG: ABC transporter transmembrane domain-containing protein, partial [Chloroflexota bacterium]